MGLKTTYYLRSMGASRIEKSTINLAKYGDKSSVDAQTIVESGPTPSTVVIQETVVMSSFNSSVPSPAEFTNQMAYAPVVVETPQVVLKEPKQFEMSAIETTETQTFPPRRVEMMGEVCESCSA